MRKIYNLQLVNTGDLYSDDNSVRIQGETDNGRKIVLNTPVYFNPHTGLLYTTKCGYIIMSYKDNEFDVDEFITQQVANVWSNNDKVGV